MNNFTQFICLKVHQNQVYYTVILHPFGLNRFLHRIHNVGFFIRINYFQTDCLIIHYFIFLHFKYPIAFFHYFKLNFGSNYCLIFCIYLM